MVLHYAKTWYHWQSLPSFPRYSRPTLKKTNHINSMPCPWKTWFHEAEAERARNAAVVPPNVWGGTLHLRVVSAICSTAGDSITVIVISALRSATYPRLSTNPHGSGLTCARWASPVSPSPGPLDSLGCSPPVFSNLLQSLCHWLSSAQTICCQGNLPITQMK